MVVSDQPHTMAASCPGKKTQLPIEKEAGWAPGADMETLEESKFLAPAGIRTPGLPVRSLVAEVGCW